MDSSEPKPNKKEVIKSEGSNLNVQLFPNPTQGLVTLKLNKIVGSGKIIIYDGLSKPIAEFLMINSNEYSIDLGNYSKGFYLVQFVNSEINTTKRLIKQ